MNIITLCKNDFCISTDKAKLDVSTIHEFLSTKAYWCLDVPKSVIEKAIQNLLCFGIYQNEKQVGFARVISDFSTIAYLGDVYVLEEYRGNGLSK